jgi:hypothetical protein
MHFLRISFLHLSELHSLQFDKYQYVDCLARLCKMRQDRGMTVQTLEQYEFIHAVRIYDLVCCALYAHHYLTSQVMLKYMTGGLEDAPNYAPGERA